MTTTSGEARPHTPAQAWALMSQGNARFARGVDVVTFEFENVPALVPQPRPFRGTAVDALRARGQRAPAPVHPDA